MRFAPPSPRFRFRAGFTLVELLTVIAIVGILVAIMVPVVGTVRDRARDSKCKSNLRQLCTAYLLYPQDNRGKVVSDDTGASTTGYTTPWPVKIEPYLVRLNRSTNQTMYEMFACPSLPEDPTRLWWNSDLAANIHGAVYASWNHGGRKAPVMLSGIVNPSRVFAFSDWLPGWRFAQVSDFGYLVTAQYKDKTFRHNGKVNLIFVDGHIEQLASPFPTDLSAAPWN